MNTKSKVRFDSQKPATDNIPQIPYRAEEILQTSEDPPHLDGTDATLLDQYYQNVNYYIKNLSRASLSTFKNEICNKVRHRSLFQAKVFGKSSTNFDVLPESTFSTFTISLHLVLRPKSFSFFTSNPGIEINDTFSDEGSYLLNFISQGYLPPRLFEEIRKLNLVWYDGGLICEIDDQRRTNCNTIRTLLRVHPTDIAKLGYESEREYLLARYPLISFDNDIQISRVARAASRDRHRWQKEDSIETPKQFVQNHYPQAFLPQKKEDKEEPPEDREEAQKALLEAIKGLNTN